MGHMETEVLANYANDQMTCDFQWVREAFDVESPWNLPVVHPGGEGHAYGVHHCIVEHSLDQGLLQSSHPLLLV